MDSGEATVEINWGCQGGGVVLAQCHSDVIAHTLGPV